MKTLGVLIVQVSGPFRGRGREGGGRSIGVAIVLALIAGMIVLAVLLLRATRNRPPAVAGNGAPSVRPDPSVHAEAILAERFARGEVGVAEFVTARQALRGEWVATPTPGSTEPAQPLRPPEA